MNLLDYDKIKSDVKKARKQGAEFLIVFTQWGYEYQINIHSSQQEFTDLFLDLGIDLVIGAHPHIIQPVKVIDNKKYHKKL